jgi:hypothetical protein
MSLSQQTAKDELHRHAAAENRISLIALFEGLPFLLLTPATRHGPENLDRSWQIAQDVARHEDVIA